MDAARCSAPDGAAMNGQKSRVAILRGGPSGEREISLLSGRSVLDAARLAGHHALDVVVERDLSLTFESGERSEFHHGLARLAGEVDVVFPVLHGPFGEDGVLQGALEIARIPYVGCGVTASALAMDKLLARRVAASLGLEVARAVAGGPRNDAAERRRIGEQVLALAPPWFVKPSCSGSSVGVTRVVAPEALEAALAAALVHGGRLVVEEGIAGHEVSCPVVGDAGIDARPLPVVAIVPKGHDFFDYEAKYRAGHSDEICPAPIAPELEARLRAAALAVHEELGCRAVSRSDFIVRDDGSLVFLEINTMPGMSSLSLVPKSLAAAGIPFEAMVSEWVEMARSRQGVARGAS
jgi:D-alanine-D-alanine ligase